MSKKTIGKSGDTKKITNDLQVKYKPYFEQEAVYFTDDSPYAYVNLMRYEMEAPSITKGDSLLIAADCLRTIYSPEMTAVIGKEVVLTYRGISVTLKPGELTARRDGQEFMLEAASEWINGHFYLDVEIVMERGFGKATRWERSYLAPGDFLGIADTPEKMFKDRETGKDLLIYLNKQKGILRRAYYFEEADKIMPYLLYIPFHYDPSIPTMMTMVLHEASGKVEEGYDLRWNPTVLETAAEERNMILLFPDGYAMGFYGGASPALQPEKCSEEEKKYLAYCENEPLCVLKKVMKEFNIDSKNVFITGNSMGGCGAFWLSLRHPEYFRALAPCGALTTDDLSIFDLTPLNGKPLLMVDGSENIGFDHVPNQVDYFNAHGVPAQWIGVAGGVHGSAWTYVFDKILDFFLEHHC